MYEHNSYEYKPNPDAYRSYGYGRFEGHVNLYTALAIIVPVLAICGWFLYQVFK